MSNYFERREQKKKAFSSPKHPNIHNFQHDRQEGCTKYTRAFLRNLLVIWLIHFFFFPFLIFCYYPFPCNWIKWNRWYCMWFQREIYCLRRTDYLALLFIVTSSLSQKESGCFFASETYFGSTDFRTDFVFITGFLRYVILRRCCCITTSISIVVKNGFCTMFCCKACFVWWKNYLYGKRFCPVNDISLNVVIL